MGLDADGEIADDRRRAKRTLRSIQWSKREVIVKQRVQPLSLLVEGILMALVPLATCIVEIAGPNTRRNALLVWSILVIQSVELSAKLLLSG